MHPNEMIKTKILVTGSNGFVGRNLCAKLTQNRGCEILRFDVNNTQEDLDQYLLIADIIFHLAGVNRPLNQNEFEEINAGLTEIICNKLSWIDRTPKIILSSSIQAELDNLYGKSKRKAEEVLNDFCERKRGNGVVYRLKNLFGKWCRPNYNSVTATFCYDISHDIPIEISDPNNIVDLTYIDDVVNAFIEEIDNHKSGFHIAEPLPSNKITLGNLADIIQSFRNHRKTLHIPDLSNQFIKNLLATYTSYLETDDFAYYLDVKIDNRGSLAELIKSPSAGQIFISRTKPGIIRGNHYHDTKIEKFVVLHGEAVICLRHIEENEIIEFYIKGEEYRVVDIPPGYTHSIQNIGANELVTLFWASEIFETDKPDTKFLDVVVK